MKFGFLTVAEHQAKMKASSDKIAALEAQLNEKEGAGSSEMLSKLTALFGEEANEDGFDLEAKVQATLDYAKGLESDLKTAKEGLTASQTKLTAATEQLDGIAKHLGQEKAEGHDLVKMVGEIEPEARKTPVKEDPKEVVRVDSEFRTEADEELEAIYKDAGVTGSDE